MKRTLFFIAILIIGSLSLSDVILFGTNESRKGIDTSGVAISNVGDGLHSHCKGKRIRIVQAASILPQCERCWYKYEKGYK